MGYSFARSQGSDAKFSVRGQNIILKQQSNYPWQGDIKFSVAVEESTECTIALRIPGWCSGAEIKVNDEVLAINTIMKNGYAEIKRIWRSGDKIEMLLPMPVEKIQANPNVRENTGKIALQRGPVVYCLEEEDNGPNLADICLPKDCRLEE